MTWIDFAVQKPSHGQLCIVAAGTDKHAQILALRWDVHEQEFRWADEDLGLDDFPTELATHWTPFPDDPM